MCVCVRIYIYVYITHRILSLSIFSDLRNHSCIYTLQFAINNCRPPPLPLAPSITLLTIDFLIKRYVMNHEY